MGFAPMANRTAAPDTTAPRDSLKHIASLDGVRGVAITLVLITHLLWSNSQTGSRLVNLLVGVRGAGWVGVDLFFALSGFLITGILFDTLQTSHYFKNFYARRVLRIFPLYYGVLLVLFAVLHPVALHQDRQLFLLFGYLQNTSLWWNGPQSVAVTNLTGHLWSLAVEEQFYLVWPVLVFCIRDRRRLLWTAAGLAVMALGARFFLLAHGASFGAVYKLTLCRADSLLAGAWLALILRGKLRETVLRYASPVFWLALVACGMMAWRTGSFDWEVSRSINSYGYSVIAIASTAFIAMALRPASITASVMRTGALRFLGKYSYGIYIFHQIVFVLVTSIFPHFLHNHFHSKIVYHVVLMSSVLLITIPLAVLSFHLYEQPFLRLKRYFNYPVKEKLNSEPQSSRDSAGSPAFR
jgi:peptidoglycan/LPS O-acetylase OafA/YrhL